MISRTRHCAAALCAALSASCGSLPGGVAVDTPFADVEIQPATPAPSEAVCVVEDIGRVVLTPGSTIFQCGQAMPAETAREGGTEAVGGGEAERRSSAESPEAAPLADVIRAAEGQPSNIAYCDPAGLHIGDGFRLALDDAEREARLCQEIENARTEAERTIGIVWQTLDQARRDVWIEVCYWSSCSGFVDAIDAIQRHDYSIAALEILDSCLLEHRPECGDIDAADSRRAWRLARWMESGRRD